MIPEFQQDIEQCLAVLSKGGLILYPTDTIWGIGCDATNAQAVEKIYALKNRPPRKSMIVLLAEERDVLQYVANPDLRVFDYLQTTQQPTTIIYEAAVGLADNLIPEDGTIAIRLVQEPFCRHLLKRFKKPIVSTSANISGEPSPQSFAGISGHIKQSVDYVVQYRQDDDRTAQPSSIIKWNRDGTVTVIRP
ncbi:MAG TPA: L-threonylcarbamoyladenylate synthase [Chitinophagaceae bacterium]|nr:L-threonylcarbamoyladenylate synthase [Chitinophagaceae bacterium]